MARILNMHKDEAISLTLEWKDDTKMITKESGEKVQAILDRAHKELSEAVEFEKAPLVINVGGAFWDDDVNRYPCFDMAMVCHPPVNITKDGKRQLEEIMYEAREKAMAVIRKEA